MAKRISRARLTRDKDVNKWLRAAKQRLTTAEFLAKHRMNLDSMYLAGYCPECVLKAMIVSRLPKHRRRTFVRTRFRTAFAHSYEYLSRLLADQFGVRLPVRIVEYLRRMAWSTDLRYEVGLRDAREAERFLDGCREILQWGERNV